ncbi:hypothetical protein PG994_000046 [Apiospora phragmitis]|uniref:Deoxyribonuclease NucA/NucB domain-containing protein n=1 Tax=Apiospora phragmitis TaxID=2905665 RepID=A0ABR1X552_9PEZI
MHTSTVTLLAMAASAVTAKGIVYDCSKTPQICLNTCWAVKCAGLPAGLHGGGNKDAKASKKKGEQNRIAWGYNSKPCAENSKHNKYWKNGNTKNTSPDEYPYASSKEGGLKGAGKPVQLRCVPTAEQKKQSGKVSGLGTAKTSAVWTTKWDNIQNLPQDWCGAAPKCVNDGHQFTATAKGVFTRSLDIGAEDIPVFEDAVYDGNSTTITVRAEEADLGGDVDDVPDVEEEEELDDGVEARDVEEADLDVHDVPDVEEEAEEGVGARDVDDVPDVEEEEGGGEGGGGRGRRGLR